MRAIIFILIGIFSYLTVNCQESHSDKEYAVFLENFYFHLIEDTLVTIEENIELFGITILEDEEYIYLENCKKWYSETECIEKARTRFESSSFNKEESLYFKELKNLKSNFTQGRTWDTIQLFVKKHDELNESAIGFDIVFPNGKVIYFYLNRYPDEPIEITNLYLEDGMSVNYHIAVDKSEFNLDYAYLKRKGIINDPDGYVNVRKGESEKSPIVGKIVTDEVFLFTPNYCSDWWKVKSANGSIDGYMHKSRITPYDTLPKETKEKL